MRGESVTQGMRMEVPVDVGHANVFLDDTADGTLCKTLARIIEEYCFRMRVLPTAGSIRLLQELFAYRPIFFQCFMRLAPIWNDAFFIALAANAQNAFFLLHVD